MLFKTLPKDELKALVEILLDAGEVIGPKRVATASDGKEMHHFLPVRSFEEMDLGYKNTAYSAKTCFLPFRENLSTFQFDDKGWAQKIEYNDEQRAIVGLHSCDINALNKLDKVFAREFFPNPYYVSRRRNTFILGMDHEPCDNGFCRAVDADTVTYGFDLFITDLGDRYFAAVGSDRGFNVLNQVKTSNTKPADTRDYLAVRKGIADKLPREVDVQNLPNLLDIEFESEVWEKWGGKCLSCGSCAMVCPTCYCYGVSEQQSMDFKSSAKVKQLYSCNLQDFALVAGGHNFRPGRQTRLKYRYYHQHRGFYETYGEHQCVGCNRCGRVCLAGINPPEVIRDLNAEERR